MKTIGHHSVDIDRLAELALQWRVHRLALSALVPLEEFKDGELYVLYEFLPDIHYGFEQMDFEDQLREACGGSEDIHIANPEFVTGPLRQRPLIRHAVIVYAAPGVAPSNEDWERGHWVMDTDEVFGGQWTAAKLECVKKYLSAYTTIMKKQRFRVAYIDAFAGSGYWAEKRDDDPAQLAFPELTEYDSSHYRDGSARIALATEPRFDNYVLIETSSSRAYRLRELRTDFPDKAQDIEVVLANANRYLLDICENRRWESHRAVLFLDPYGMQVDWTTVEAIARTAAIDMWYLFPLGVAVNRLLRRDARISSSIRSRLDGLFGSDAWFDAFYEVQERMTLTGVEACTVKTGTFDTIAAFVNHRLSQVFAGVAQKPLALCNSKNVPIYLLCFAASNKRGAPTAVKIAQDVMLKEMAK
jgi:three-Cys-motif partner protein